MAKELIEDYRIGWSVKLNRGRVLLKIVGDDVYNDVPISSNAEFMAVTNLLNGEKKVFVDIDSQVFVTVDSDSFVENGMKQAISDPSRKLKGGTDPWPKTEGDDPFPM